MANITAQQVNELRARTGAGLMDCKKALVEAEGDADAAAEILRKKGAATRDKKAGRTANEGTIQSFVSDDASTGALVEVNCESDFVGKNELFQAFVKGLAAQIATSGSADNLAEQPLVGDPSKKVNDLFTEQITKTGENLVPGRTVLFAKVGTNGYVQSYLHNGGKIAVLVGFEVADATSDAFKTLAKQVAMHIAAASPLYLTRDEVPAETVEKEKEIVAAQMTGKPAQAIEKIVQGKLEKFYAEVCLREQPFVLDTAKSVAAAANAVGAIVTRFARLQIGA
ncbi:MAG: translation elongation factor Ts [Puniceicoccales bacterium]|jgi:elongation factor Ts|nr:translation elongation factor Ts [Puniceicoccales bacterium]